MDRKTVSGIMLTLLLIGMLVLAFNIQSVKASGTIYIGSDYIFTSNIYEPIIVTADNIILDGNGYTLQGIEPGIGIDLTGRSNVTIRNMKIKAFYYGIYLSGSSNNTISGNTITANNLDGIYLFESSNNSISGNNITNNRHGIYLHNSLNNALSGNVMDDNRRNLRVRGSELSHYLHSIDVSNLVNGKPVYYLVNQKNLVINPATHPQVGYLALISSTNATVEGVTLTDNEEGLLLANTNNSRIIDNTITNNYYGIYLFESSNNSISGNNITNTYGIYLFESSGNTMSGNNITANNLDGINLYSSSNNTISGNTITNNWDYGITLAYSSNNNTVSGNNITANNLDGVMLWYSSDYNTVSGNNITDNGGGIALYSSSNNIISGNNIINHYSHGVYFYNSLNNKFYNNNFVNNTQQVIVGMSGCANVWDDGYPSGGNYWSDHVCTGNPSDGTQPYIIDENNTDHYPFQNSNGWLLPPPKAVGGKATPINIPMNKPETPTLWIWLTIIILSLAVTVVYVKKRKKNTRTIP